MWKDQGYGTNDKPGQGHICTKIIVLCESMWTEGQTSGYGIEGPRCVKAAAAAGVAGGGEHQSIFRSSEMKRKLQSVRRSRFNCEPFSKLLYVY